MYFNEHFKLSDYTKTQFFCYDSYLCVLIDKPKYCNFCRLKYQSKMQYTSTLLKKLEEQVKK